MTLAPAAADDRSVRVIRPTQSFQILSAGLTELWSHKSLFLEMTRLRLKVRYKQSLLGWTWAGAVAGLVGIECGVVSGVINLESSGVEAPDWRPRHDKQYHAA